MTGRPSSDPLHTTIRWRFTLWISAVLIISIGVTFVIIYRETTNRLRGQIERDLSADATQLEQALRLVGGGTAASSASAARSYMSAQSFQSISTLLFVLGSGPGPVSNYPELFATTQAETGETGGEQAAENALTRRLLTPRPGFSTEQVPDVGAVRLFERTLRIRGERLTIGAGESLQSVSRAQQGVVKSFLLAGAFIALAVVIGSYLVGTRVTAPLRRMARVAERVDAGDLEPRMAVAGRDEVAVLAGTFNHMLERLDEAFSAQREFVADASHELRTPLTVIQGQLEVLANRSDPDASEVRRVEQLVRREIQRMRRLVDDLLVLAQAERPDFLRPEPVTLTRFLAQLRDDATLVAERRFELGPVPAGRLQADPDRLAQAIRNLIGNAIAHTSPTSGLVRIEARRTRNAGIAISVLDDGPGIPDDELGRIFDRFHRAGSERASAQSGAGLGLAIVRAIAEAHGGTVVAANAPGGGARFEIVLPGFVAPSR